MPNLRELSAKEELFACGHRLCAGCTASVVVRQVLMAAENPVIATASTGCLEVASSIYPYTAWRIPWFHSAFENAAPTLAGIETMYRSLQKQGKFPKDKKIDFIAFSGDGGTYDIGLQSLSGTLERGHNILYICYDNEAYMNTGIQRSSATPMGAATTTSPAGKVIPGKQQPRKNLTKIVAAHGIPYLAQAAPSHWRDLVSKVKKALAADGPAFLNIIAPCHRGWRTKVEIAIELARLAVETCFWPLYEVTDGILQMTHHPKKKKDLTEWLKLQGRFKHLFQPANQHIIDKLQQEVDREWEQLLSREGQSFI